MFYLRKLIASVSILALLGCQHEPEIRISPALEVEPTVSETYEPLDTGPWSGLNAKIRVHYGTFTDQTVCLATNIYHEARGSTLADQIAVANVVRNRATSDRTSFCRVVWRKHQFSWTRDGRPDYPWDRAAFQDALQLAEKFVRSEMKDNTGGANHYHKVTIEPYWSVSGKDKKIIGAHTYMKI